MYDAIKDICVRESKLEFDSKFKKNVVKKTMQTSKSKSKLTTNNKENNKDHQSSKSEPQNIIIKCEFPTEYKCAKEFEELNIKLRDRISMLELHLQDKDVEVEDLKTRVDVICLDMKQEKENHLKRVEEMKQESKQMQGKLNEAKRHAAELQATLVAPSDFKSKQEELSSKMDEISKLKSEIRRLNDSLQIMKNEKLDMVKKIALMEDSHSNSSKNNEESNKLKSEISRKEKTIQTLRMNIEELKTERDLYCEQSRSINEK